MFILHTMSAADPNYTDARTSTELFGVDAKYRSLLRRLIFPYRSLLIFLTIGSFIFIAAHHFEPVAFITCLFIYVFVFTYSFFKNIKALHKVELLEDGGTVRITLFYFNSLRSVECRKENYRVNVWQHFGGRSSDEICLYVNKKLYYTQDESGVWTAEKIAYVKDTFVKEKKE